MSALSRGTVILLANLSSGIDGAAGAMLAEVCYRSLTSGFCSSAIQAFRNARPLWRASIVSMVLLPAIGEIVEFFMHRIRGTQRLGVTIAVSIFFTATSTLFELCAMRHGILLVGQTGGSLKQDVKKALELIMSFIKDALHWFLPQFRPRRKGGRVSCRWIWYSALSFFQGRHRICAKYLCNRNS
jgi:hypothetical protein